MNSKNILMSLLFVTGVGCSSAPREVDASIALVPENKPMLVGEIVPASIEKYLNQDVSQSINYNNYMIEILPIYISALGFNCATLIFETKNINKILQTACQNKNSDSWVLIKSISKTDKKVVL